MDFGRLFGRSFILTLGQRRLWILGLAATSGSFTASLLVWLIIQFGLPAWLAPDQLPAASGLDDVLDIGTLAGIVLATLLAWLLFWLIGAVAEAGLIYGVAALERDERLTIPRLATAGGKLLGRFVAIDTVLFLPLFLMVLALAVVLTAGMVGLVVVATRPGSDLAGLLMVAGFTGIMSMPFMILVIPLTIATLFLRLLAFRTATLENRNAGDSIRRAWHQLRHKPGSIISLALLLWGVGYVVGIPFRVASLPLTFLGLIRIVESTPAAIAVSARPEWALVIAGFLIVLLNGLMNALLHTFTSTAWTKAFLDWSGEAALM